MDGAATTPRKIMVVADPGRESAGALQWALYHSAVDHDELILLHVENSASWRNTFTTFLRRPQSINTTFVENVGGELEFLDQMKKACELVQPKVKVRIERVDMGGKDKSSTVLMESNAFAIDVLVIGQRRGISNAILGCRRSGGSVKGMDMAEYLIENSKCTCVGVQKKGPDWICSQHQDSQKLLAISINNILAQSLQMVNSYSP